MRNFYRKYFYIPKHGKIKDNVMLIRTVATAVTMILCLAVMSFTAYAYFSCNVTSGYNRIQAANFDADVSINIIEKATQNPVDVKKVKSTCTAELEAGTTYSVTLSYGKSTSTTGFCVITAKNCLYTYHTQQLWKTPGEGKMDSITFSLTVSKTTTVEIGSHWGTSSRNGTNDEWYICHGETVNIDISDHEIHVVASGETLGEIASLYDVSVDELATYNKIENRDLIVSGQKLTIPETEKNSTDSEESNFSFSSHSETDSDGSETTDTTDVTDAPATGN